MPQMTPEQMKQLQERLSKMSPEELKAYQKQQCIFCQIISGKVQSKKIYDDEQTIAILDINPANPGHTLVLPKEHYAIMPLIPKEIIGHLFMVAKALSQVMLKSIGAQGVNIFVANGVPAGQKAQHFMLHIIPRKEKDGVGLQIPSMSVGNEQLIQIRDALKAKIKEQLKYGVGEKGVVEAEVSEVKREEPKARPKQEKETEKEQPSRQKFITSAKAKRFHVETCPFGNKIKEDSRLYCTKEECEKTGKKPCDCTGIVELAGENAPKKKTKDKKSKAEKSVNLNDIARTLGL